MTVFGFTALPDCQAATTTTMSACALAYAMSKNEQVLVAGWDVADFHFAPYFAEPKESEPLIVMERSLVHGFAALRHVTATDELRHDAQRVRDYARPVIRGMLDWLDGARTVAAKTDFAALLLRLRNSYAHAYFEVDYLSAEAEPNALHESVETLVICVEQNRHALEHYRDFLRAETIQRRFPNARHVQVMVTRYDGQARLSMRNMQRKYAPEFAWFAIPYSSSFRNACNERELADLFLRYFFSKSSMKDERLFEWFQALRKWVDGAHV
jgi:hypothetical protein